MKTAVMWRLSAYESDYRWSYYTWLSPGPTAEDAMRAVILRIKESNAEWSSDHPDPIPAVMWAVPFRVPSRARQIGSGRDDIGEDFEEMFDYGAMVEVRL